MVGLFVARTGRRHVRHHHIGPTAQPFLDLRIRVILHKVQRIGLGPRDRFDLAQVDAQNGADGLALFLAQGVDAFDRDLTPAPRRTAKVHHPRTRHEEAELVVQFEDLIGRATAIAVRLGAAHIGVVQLPFQPQGRAELATACGFDLDPQIALTAPAGVFCHCPMGP